MMGLIWRSAHPKGHYEDETNNTTLVMDHIMKSQKELAEDQKELGNKIDRLIDNTHKLFTNRVNMVAEDSKERWLE